MDFNNRIPSTVATCDSLKGSTRTFYLLHNSWHSKVSTYYTTEGIYSSVAAVLKLGRFITNGEDNDSNRGSRIYNFEHQREEENESGSERKNAHDWNHG